MPTRPAKDVTVPSRRRGHTKEVKANQSLLASVIIGKGPRRAVLKRKNLKSKEMSNLTMIGCSKEKSSRWIEIKRQKIVVCRKSQQWRMEEALRYEATQDQLSHERREQEAARQKQEKSRQIFETAMLTLVRIQTCPCATEGAAPAVTNVVLAAPHLTLTQISLGTILIRLINCPSR
ncbi:hypothetical protein VP01_2101g1 [Puccinia sorghi]|uniref:Uncharacterized protein n=1 Tax=Puccinia sorghi TaxID=27349 RepID=A0A0L6VAT4_9BASI|nr:hypothetical protein VP01_2101g1 [Puccinia sorghi]